MRIVSLPTVISFALVLLLSCGDSNQKKPAISTNQPTTVTQTVGSSGGTVRHPDGASVVIPAGALTGSALISITVHDSSNSFTTDYSAGILKNPVVEFGPKGQTFLAPVTISYKVINSFNQAGSYGLFELNEDTHVWKETDFPVTISSDGLTVQADVTHFTVYQCFPDFEGRKAAFNGKFKQLLEENNGDFRLAMGYFLSWFYNYEPRINLGDEAITDNGVYQLEQMFFQIIAKDDLNVVQHVNAVGADTSRKAEDWVFSESFLSEDSEGKLYTWELLAVVHWALAAKSVTVFEPQNGASVSGIVQIQALTNGDILNAANFDSIGFYVDQENICTDTTAPFTCYWDTTNAAGGDHFINLVANYLGKEYYSEVVKVTVALSNDKAITGFIFPMSTATIITEATHSITVTVPVNTVVTALVPTITHTGASISPASGVANNFTSGQIYRVTAADGSTQDYTIIVLVSDPFANPVADTGQTQCSSGANGDGAMAACSQTITGQDGDYANIPNARSFATSSHAIYTTDYTTKDNVTGLIWKTCPEGQTGSTCTGTASTYLWDNALTACTALNSAHIPNGYAGRTDWRLPSNYELQTIVNYGLSNPSIDTAFFPTTVTSGWSYCWSSSPYVLSSDSAWFVNFGYGNMLGQFKRNGAYVRCVSGP